MIRCLSVCLLSGTGVLAQNSPFRVQTNVVQVPVMVTEQGGRTVSGLAARDFRVLDNGAPQQATMDDFSSDAAPISLAIAIQTSGISNPALTMIRHIGGMIQPLVIGQRGEAAVVTFDSKITWLQDFTPDDDKIRAAVQNLRAGAMGQARMLDAIVEVAARMQPRTGRKVLLLISESRDRGSETAFGAALEAIERQGIEVFGAHYSAYATSLLAKPEDIPSLPPAEISGDPEDWLDSPPGIDFLAIFKEIGRAAKTNAIQALTRVTGGADFPFMKERGVEHAIEKLGAEIHSQYLLSFPQRVNSAGIHRIDVSVPGHGDLQIRARQSYWADRGQ